MKKISILIIAIFFCILLIPSTKNSIVLAAGCSVQLGYFHLYQTQLNGNRILLDPSTSFADVLVNNKELKNGQITGLISATQTGCGGEFSRWAGTYEWDGSRTAGLWPAGCDPSKTYDCLDHRWAQNPGGSFPASGNPVFTDWPLGTAGIYMIRGAAYGAAAFPDDSWSWAWTAGRLFYYEVVNSLSIDSAGNLTGSITTPWYDGVSGSSSGALPNYYLLISTDPSTLINQSSDPSEIQVFATSSNYKGSPNWQLDINFNFQVLGLTPGKTYYWRIRQQGSALTTYIPGGNFAFNPPPSATLSASPDSGLDPLSTELTANVALSTPPITYYFWWNCTSNSTDLTTVVTSCGAANATFNTVSSNTQTTTHTYSGGSYVPKLLAKLADNTYIQAQSSVVVETASIFEPISPTSTVINNKIVITSDVGGNNTGVFSSSDGANWNQDQLLTSTTAGCAASIVFNGKIWLIGVDKIDGITGGIYTSPNGIDWTTASPYPIPTHCASAIVFNSKLWVTGGLNNDKVYSTSDGITWTLMGNLPVQLWRHNSALLNGKIWLIGGADTTGFQRKVYSSSDGISWTNPGTTPLHLYDPRAVTFNSKLWLLGGRDDSFSIFNDKVYSSSDGISWTVTGTLPPDFQSPTSIISYTSVVFNDKLWLIGYWSNPAIASGHARAFAYSSSDGITWTSVFKSCEGTLSLGLSPNPVVTNTTISAAISGISGCSGFNPVVVTSPSLFNTPSYTSTCVFTSTGCTALFKSPATPGAYTYYAGFDKNGNDVIEPSETTSATINVIFDTGGGTGGGTSGDSTGGGSLSSKPGCDASSTNRATGLVTAPQQDSSSKFNTSGGCAIDPNTTFAPYKIPTFDDLESLYYTQK